MTQAKDDQCSGCHGTGQDIRMMLQRPGQPIAGYKPCPTCEGSGKSPKKGGLAIAPGFRFGR
jgi:DnaJ-class molecular chaperone